MTIKFPTLIIAAATALFACATSAEIKMSGIFSDHMMLQRNASVKIWGSASSDAKIGVEFASAKVSAKADSKGQWSLKLPPMKASAEPREMTIFENGKPSKKIGDILVGEIWIAGGQSNMAFGMARVKDGKKLIDEADKNPLVRYFNQGETKMKSLDGIGSKPLDFTADGSRWLKNNSQNAQNIFKAIPFIFATDLSQKLGVPVGIVYTAVPGTRMVSWIPRDVFENNPAFANQKKIFEQRIKAYNPEKEIAKFEDDVKTYPARVAKAKKEGKRPPEAWTVSEGLRPWPDSPYKWASPCMLYNARIHPVRNFTARGILWYQGESDTPEGFDEMFDTFVNLWRDIFGQPKMPFIFAQLPAFRAENWAKIRLSQQATADRLKNVHIATCVDTGTRDDVHPTEKLPLAHRLSRLALANVYAQKDVVARGPKAVNCRFDGNFAKVAFDGKIALDGKARGFEILADGNWIAPDVKVNANTIVLSAPDKSAKVEGARYLFKGWTKPDVCIFGAEKLPAYPFLFGKK